jgi:hypothetical protein
MVFSGRDCGAAVGVLFIVGLMHAAQKINIIKTGVIKADFIASSLMRII